MAEMEEVVCSMAERELKLRRTTYTILVRPLAGREL